jgi:hypothetical protein
LFTIGATARAIDFAIRRPGHDIRDLLTTNESSSGADPVRAKSDTILH